MAENVNTNPTLVYETETKQGPLSLYEKDKPAFWALTILFLCMSLVAVAGNGLVLHVSFTNRNYGPLKYLDCVVQSLAVADMLFGLIGIPCRIIGTNIVTRGV